MKTFIKAYLCLLLGIGNNDLYSLASPCKTYYLDLSTGKQFDNNTFYGPATEDPYWRISDGPPAQGPYPYCATSIGGNNLNTCMALSVQNSGMAIGNVQPGSNCDYFQNPYVFERQIEVETGAGNPVVTAFIDIGFLNTPFVITTITLNGPGGPFILLPSCLQNFPINLPLYNVPVSTGVYTLQVHIGNPGQNNINTSMMFLQMQAAIYSSAKIFTDNHHFGKQSTCSPPYPVLHTPVLANACIPFGEDSVEVLIDNFQTFMSYTVNQIPLNNGYSFWANTGNSYVVTASDAFGCSVQTTLSPSTCMIDAMGLKLYIEGYYVGNGLMKPLKFNQGLSLSNTDVDDVTIEIREANPPYALLRSINACLQTDGLLYATFPALIGNYYYLVVKHRNSTEIWTSAPLPLNPGFYYNFTVGPQTVFGNNQVPKENNWCMLSGDVNQDGSVDAQDYMELELHITQGSSGYLLSDLNGDGGVDLLDYLILNPHVEEGATLIRP